MASRVVDQVATKIARARHQRGVDLLHALFGWNEEEARQQARDKRKSFPAAERARRRACGKTQRRARQRNRI